MAENASPGEFPDRDLDIAPILEGWDYQPGEVVARLIRDAAGREKIQMRLALGLIQMEVAGRPDGQRPHGRESLLDYHQARLRKHPAFPDDGPRFSLSHEECEELREEGLIYYYRYLCLFQLRDFAGVARDTERNLRMVDFISAYCSSQVDRLSVEQFRPYITMMNARAAAYLALEQNDIGTAAAKLNEAIDTIRAFYRQAGHEVEGVEAEELIGASNELRILEELLHEIQSFPVVEFPPAAEPGPQRAPAIEDLRRQLKDAVAREDYERAAVLRDQIKRLDEQAQRQSAKRKTQNELRTEN